MDPSSNGFSRCFALSALLHASLGSIGMTMVRLGDADEAPVAAVEVSLVERLIEPQAATQVAAAPLSPANESVAPSPIAAPPTVIEAPPATAAPATSEPSELDVETRVTPRFDAGSDASTANEGIMTLASSPPLAIGEGPGAGGTAEGGDAVRAWLEKHKRYPRAATQRRIEGEAILELVIESSGVVASSRIVRSSGHAVLDDEVRRMVARAVPFPLAARPNSGTAQYRIAIEFYLEEE
jgi:protein TonB